MAIKQFKMLIYLMVKVILQQVLTEYFYKKTNILTIGKTYKVVFEITDYTTGYKTARMVVHLVQQQLVYGNLYKILITAVAYEQILD